MTHSHSAFWAHLQQGPVYKSIIVLSGTRPDSTFFQECTLPVIAVDGAANSLLDAHIEPHLILGDLDSLKRTPTKTPTLHLPDQNSGDFEKTVKYLEKIDLLPAIIVGINGGCIDHVLNNINIVMQTDSIFYDPPIVAHVLRPGTFSCTLPVRSKVSLMGMPSALVSSSGLKWELARLQLDFPGQTSCFNRVASAQFTIDVHEGLVLLMLYLVPIQDAGLDQIGEQQV